MGVVCGERDLVCDKIDVVNYLVHEDERGGLCWWKNVDGVGG